MIFLIFSIQHPNTYRITNYYDIELQGKRGEPICVNTLSNHCNGPFRCSSIQHGVEVTVCLLIRKLKLENKKSSSKSEIIKISSRADAGTRTRTISLSYSIIRSVNSYVCLKSLSFQNETYQLSTQLTFSSKIQHPYKVFCLLTSLERE